jgi:hypothetical protein
MAVKRRVLVSTLGCDNGVVPSALFILPQVWGVIQWWDWPDPDGGLSQRP